MGYNKSILLVLFLFACSLIVGCAQEDIEIPRQQSYVNNNDDSGNEVCYGPNLMQNGGLEEWGYALTQYLNPIGWLPHNNNNVTRDHKTKYEGKYSAKLCSIKRGSTARIDQVVPVTPGEKIRIYFKYYVEQWETNGARTYCYFRTGPAENTTMSISELREIYTNDEYYVIRGGGFGKMYLPHTLKEWLVFDEIITVPPMAKNFVFGVNSYYGTTLYVDDCYVVEIAK